MIRDDIIETSNSHILNPLTIVSREGKNPRISIDAREVNQCTIPDRERVPPIHEISMKYCKGLKESNISLRSTSALPTFK
jgi:hypothetical protein